MSNVSALSTQLRRSAESVGLRGGHLVPLRYGSAAGELAVCMRSVGLVDRADLQVLEVVAAPAAIARLTAEISGGEALAAGEVATVGGAHWGLLAPGRALVALPSASAPLLCEQLLRIPGHGEAAVEETNLHAIGLIGPATAGLLTDLGTDAALAAANGRGRIAELAAAGPATWMFLDGSSALALVDPADAVTLWGLLSRAGRRFALSYVGAEAAERFEAVRCRAGRAHGP